MAAWIAIGISCLAVGLLIGWCGVAGFLLPILFMNCGGFAPTESMLLSFSCFALSGAVGSFHYHRRGELPLKTAPFLCAGSIFGSLGGAALAGLFVPETVKRILYIVVLLSGIAIFLQELLLRREASGEKQLKPVPLLLLGLSTAVLCSLSGAGGPVLVMPILVVLGTPVKEAVGAALLDSVFIALPAIFIYGGKCSLSALAFPLLFALACHGAGIAVGSRTAAVIPQKLLKRGVSVFSVCFALYMLK